MKERKILNSFNNSWKAFVSLIKTLYKAMPILMITFTFIMIWLIDKFSINSTLQLSLLTVVIFISTIAVYLKSKNYGEAVLALSAGLFTIYTVDWTVYLFISFIIVWVAFTIVVFLSTSIKLSSQSETIYLEATFALKSNELSDKDCEKKLRAIANSLQNSIIGPIEKAEIIRTFAFKKLSLDDMPVALKWVNMFFALTRIHYLDLADFVIIVIKRTKFAQNHFSIDKIFDYIYDGMRSASASPQEYIEIFNLTRHHLIKSKDIIRYFETLKLYFDQDTTIVNMNTYFDDALNNI